MRWSEAVAGSLFRYVDLEKRIRADHLLRVIRLSVNAAPDLYAGRRQRIRGARLRRRVARDQRYAACGAEYQQALLGHRRPHHAPLRLCRQFAHQEASRGVRLGHDPWPCCTRCLISGCPRSTGSSLSPWRPIYPPTEAAGGYGVIPGSHPICVSGAESLPLATVICQRRAETGHHHGRKPGWAKPFSATC